MWQNRWLNRLTDLWIGTLQGHPVFLFEPAHIASHHRYNQGLADVTRVARYAKNNHVIGYIIFPLQVLPAITALKKEHLRRVWHEDRTVFWWIMAQHVPLLALWASALALSPQKALLYVFLPQVFSLHFLLASNYLQHAHATPGARFDHSRNFVGAINWLWFNVGYHTAHHEWPALHWTSLPAAHREIASRINPKLNESSLARYFCGTLVLGMFFSRFRSKAPDKCA